MPTIEGRRRINPLDSNKNVRIGVAFPLNETNLFQGTQTFKEQVKTNLINVLLTEPGERINEPNFGVGLKGLLFEQNINKDDLQERIQEAVSQDENLSRITISNINLNQDINTNTVRVTIEYISNLDGSSDAIQIGIGSINERGPAPYEQ